MEKEHIQESSTASLERKQSISLKIDDKRFYLKIKAVEEAYFREGALLLNKKIAGYRSRYLSDDFKERPLYMAAIDISSRLARQEEKTGGKTFLAELEKIQEKLYALRHKLDE